MTKNKHGHACRQAGVTIVELLVYVGLLSIFILVLVDVFGAVLRARLESESTSSISQDARYILAKLSYDVANANSFTVPAFDRLVLDGTKTYTLTGNNLTLNNLPLNSLDTKINSISFTKIGNTVKTIFTVESLIELPSGPKTQTIESTFGLRP